MNESMTSAANIDISLYTLIGIFIVGIRKYLRKSSFTYSFWRNALYFTKFLSNFFRDFSQVQVQVGAEGRQPVHHAAPAAARLSVPNSLHPEVQQSCREGHYGDQKVSAAVLGPGQHQLHQRHRGC